MDRTFTMELDKIQPSQLYISSEKLSQVMKEFDSKRMKLSRPIPIKQLNDDVIYTDGHTRAFTAYLNGLEKINVFWDEDDLDWEAYEICVKWCKDEGIYKIADLRDRIVNAEEYKLLWHKRCDIMHNKLESKRLKQL